jgi:hypothetical protein
VSVIRAFTYFSHLANLAEDRHHIRRRAIHERAGDTQEGSIEVALARLRWAGIAAKTVSQTLAQSYLSPVLTAHPTEVQRKSILDAERDIANMLTGRDEIKARALPKDALAPRELAANEAQIRARVLQLWQNAPAALHQAHRRRRDRECAELLRGHVPARDSPRYTPTWSASWASILWRASCAWASGSAAIATAIPTSARRRWNTRCAGSVRWRCATT